MVYACPHRTSRSKDVNVLASFLVRPCQESAYQLMIRNNSFRLSSPCIALSADIAIGNVPIWRMVANCNLCGCTSQYRYGLAVRLIEDVDTNSGQSVSFIIVHVQKSFIEHNKYTKSTETVTCMPDRFF